MALLELRVDPFLGREINRSEAEEDIQTELDQEVEELYAKYERLGSHLWYLGYDLKPYTPIQINQLFRKINREMSIDRMKHAKPGKLITLLINHAYITGQNNFILSAEDNKICDIAYELRCNEARPLDLTIIGNPGNYFADKSEGCIFTIIGHIKFGMEYSKYCNYLIRGDVTGGCGWHTTGCTFIFEGSVSGSFGFWSKNNVYKTSNPETYQTLIQLTGINNVCQLLNDKGTVLEEFHKHL